VWYCTLTRFKFSFERKKKLRLFDKLANKINGGGDGKITGYRVEKNTRKYSVRRRIHKRQNILPMKKLSYIILQ